MPSGLPRIHRAHNPYFIMATTTFKESNSPSRSGRHTFNTKWPHVLLFIRIRFMPRKLLNIDQIVFIELNRLRKPSPHEANNKCRRVSAWNKAINCKPNLIFSSYNRYIRKGLPGNRYFREPQTPDLWVSHTLNMNSPTKQP